MREITGYYGHVADSFNNPLAPEDLSAQVSLFNDALLRFISHPPTSSSAKNVSAYRAMGYALYSVLNDPGAEGHVEICSSVERLLEARQDMSPDHKVTHLRQSFFYANFDKLPTRPLENVETWRELIVDTVTDEHKLQLISESIDLYRNQANIPQRYAGVLLALAVIRKKQPINLVDIGASAGLGLAQLKNQVPFDQFDIAATEKQRRRICRLFNEGINFQSIVGYDIMPQPNPLWVEACSTQISEIGDRELIAKRAHLYELIRDQKIHVLPGDIVTLKLPENQPASVVSAINCLYEILPVKLHQKGYKRVRPAISVAQRNIESIAQQEGSIIVQDYARINPRNRGRLIFEPDIYAASSRHALFIKVRPGDDWIELGHWDGGRCRQFFPTAEYIEMSERV